MTTRRMAWRLGRALVLTALLLPGLGVACAWAQGSDRWPAWRGLRDNGSSERGSLPVKWDTNSVAWKTALPGKGCSTPAVWDDRIFLTAPTNGLDAVVAFDLAGKPMWITTLGPERPGQHRNGSGCNPSPATDGSQVFVYFKSGDLAAVDFGGKVRWQTNLVQAFGPDTLYWDQGTSPLLTEKDVVIVRMHHDESWLAAFSKSTGQIEWKVERNYDTPEEDDNAYTTPVVIREQGKEAVLTWGAEHLTAHEATQGRLLWSCGGFNPDSVPNWPAVASPVVAGDVAIVATGRADRGKPLLYGVRLGGIGDITKTHRLWKRDDTGTFVPTPSVYQGRVYLLRDRGEVECLDPKTGQSLWHGVLPKASFSFYASPLVAGGKLYAAREDGVVFVASVNGAFEVLAENVMGERIVASPVALSSRLLIRGEHHLFCIGSAQ